MSTLDRYIGKLVLLSCLLVLLTIASLDTLFSLLGELDNLTANYTFILAFEHVVLSVPRRFVDYLSISAMVGSLIGLGVLANNSELTVMRAAGLSTGRIFLAVIKPVLLLWLVTLGIGEFVAPKMEQAADALRAEQLGGGRDKGLWHKEENWFLNIGAIDHQGDLVGLALYKFDDNQQLEQAGVAKRATYSDGNWTLHNVRISHFEEQQVRLERTPEAHWQAELDPDLLSVLLVKPAKMSMHGLYSYAQYTLEQGVDARPYLLAFWQKLFMPLAIIALVLIAMSSVFGPLRSVTMGQRVLVGFMVGIVFKIVQELLGPASTVYGFSPIFASLGPILICFVVGIVLLRRAS